MAGSLKQRMFKERDRLLEMYHKRGMSLTDIGRAYGCSRQYVQLIFIALGIERRDRQEALQISPNRRKSKFRFRPDQDSYISRNYNRMTDQELAMTMAMPVNAVTYRRLIVLGKKKISRRNFSQAENEFIMENYTELTDMVIARKLKRSLISVTHHRNRVLNCPKRLVRSYTKEEDRFIRQNYMNMTDGELAEKLNRSKASVSIHRHEVLGLVKLHRRS